MLFFPFINYMLSSTLQVHFVLKELVRKSISETEVSNVSAMSQQCFQKRKSISVHRYLRLNMVDYLLSILKIVTWLIN